MKSSKPLIYFPAGIISLCLLPIISIYYLNTQGAFDRKTAVVVYHYSEWGGGCTGGNPTSENILKNKNISHFEFSGNPLTNQVIFRKAKWMLAHSSQSADRSQALHFKFDKVMNYKTIVETFAACQTSGYENIVWINQEAWVFYGPPSEYSLPFCGNRLYPSIRLYTNAFMRYKEAFMAWCPPLKLVFLVPMVLWICMLVLVLWKGRYVLARPR